MEFHLCIAFSPFFRYIEVFRATAAEATGPYAKGYIEELFRSKLTLGPPSRGGIYDGFRSMVNHGIPGGRGGNLTHKGRKKDLIYL